MRFRTGLLLPLVLFCIGCLGTEVTNPDEHAGEGGSGAGTGGQGGTGGAGGSGGGSGAGGAGGSGGSTGELPVVVTPEVVDFGTICPGGIARVWLELETTGTETIEIEIASGELIGVPEELYLEPGVPGRTTLVFTPPPGEEDGAVGGEIWFGPIDQEPTNALPWTAEIDATATRPTILCGDEVGPCEGLHGSADSSQIAIYVTNDGCTDLVVTEASVEVESGDPVVELATSPLPATLAPLQAIGGSVEFTQSDRPASGTITFTLGDGSQLVLPWSWPGQSTR